MKELVNKTLYVKFFVLAVAFCGLSITSYAQEQQEICSGQRLDKVHPSAPSSVRYTWGQPGSSGATSGATAQTQGQPSVNSTLINLTTATVSLFYTITCSNPAFNFTLLVTLRPNPKMIADPVTTNICSGGTFSFSTASATPDTEVRWNRVSAPGISPPTNFSPFASSNNISEPLTNDAGSQRTATYTISLRANGCPENVQTLSVNVDPTPKFSSALTAEVCSGTEFFYTPASPQIPSGSFTWKREAVAGVTNPSETGTDNPRETLTNTVTVSVTVSYVYRLTSPTTGCSKEETVLLQVRPLPRLISATSHPNHCSGQTFSYGATSSLPGTTFNWSRGTVANVNPAGTSGVGTNNINEQLTNVSGAAATVVYVFSLSAGNCTNNNQNVNVTVNPLPELRTTLTPSAVCSGITFNYTPASSQSPVTFAWSRASVANISNGSSSDNSINNGSISEALNNTGTESTSVLYQYMLRNSTTNCINNQIVTLIVSPIPVVSDLSITVCNNNGFISIPTTTPLGVTYTWTAPSEPLPGGAITNTLSGETNPQPVVRELIFRNGTASSATVKYTVTPSIRACMGQTFVITVTVLAGATPTVGFESPLSAPAVCSGTPFQYTFSSNSPSPTYNWDRLPVAGISNGFLPGSGTDINETLIDTSAIQVIVPYYVKVSSAGCSNGFIVSVPVNPVARLNSPLTPVPICSNTSFLYSPTSRVITSQVNWSRTPVLGITSSASGNGSGNINETLINATAAPVSVRYTFTLITPANPACTGSDIVTVVVNPAPTLSSPINPTAICSGNRLSYTATSATDGTLFNWTRAVAANITNPSSAGFNIIDDLLINSSITTATAIYQFTLIANGCSNAQQVTATVKPTPSVANQTPPPICSNASFSVAPLGMIAGIRYSWANPISVPSDVVSGGVSATSQLGISQSLRNITTIQGKAVYTVTPVADGCIGANFSVDIPVNPVPVIISTPIPAVCSGSPFVYSPPSIPTGTIYTWVSPFISPGSPLSGGSAQAAQSSITQTLVLSGITPASADYTITPSFQGCFGSNFVLTVPVNPVPQIGTLATPVCSGNTFTVTPTSVPASTAYTWATPESAPVGSVSGALANASPVSSISQQLSTTSVTPVTTVYNVVPVAGTCSGNTFSVTVTVNPATQLSSSLTPPATCSNKPFSYEPTSATPSTNIFNWTRAVVPNISNAIGTGSRNVVNEELVNTTNSPVAVTYTYMLETTAGCKKTENVTVIVNPKSVLTNNPSPAPVCSGIKYHYTPAANTGGSAVFNWLRASATNISNGSATGTNDPDEALVNTSISTAQVQYIYTITAFGCSNTETVLVNVKPVPVVTNKTESSCSNTAFVINAGSVPSGTQYSWLTPVSNPVGIVSGGSAQTLQNAISQVLTNATLTVATATYTVTPVSDGCSGNTFSVTVSVKPVPVVSGITLSPTCSGNTFSYTPPSIPAGTTFSWNVPVVTPTASLTGGTTQAAQALFSQALNSINNIANTAVYDVVPATNGCNGTIFRITIRVDPVPTINNQTVGTCSDIPFRVEPTNVPQGTTYTWPTPSYTPSGSINGGTPEVVPQSLISQRLSQSGTTAAQALYTVTATAGACSSPFSITVNVNPPPKLSSTLTPPATCSSTPFNYEPTSATPVSNIFNWTRAAVAGISNAIGTGSGNVVNEELVNTTNSPVAVTYTYMLETTAGCKKTENVTVIVNPKSVLTNKPPSPNPICSGIKYHYTPAANTGGSAVFNWSRALATNISNPSGTGTNDPGEELVNTSTTTAQVQYIYTITAFGCSNTETVLVNVKPVPVVTNKTESSCSNTAFVINAGSVPSGTQYSWFTPVSNPADVIGGRSPQSNQASIGGVLSNPTISSATATYNVTPNADGCRGPDFAVEVTVKPAPVILDIGLSAVCSGSPFSHAPSNVPAGTQYSWNVPISQSAGGLDGGSPGFFQNNISQTLSSSNNIANTAEYTVSPIANGCPGASFKLTVPVNPTPTIGSSTISVCSGNTFSVNPAPVPSGTMYTWGTPVQSPPGFVTGAVAQNMEVASISQQLISTNTSDMEVRYNVIPKAGSCPGNTFSVTVTVNPSTKLSSTLNPSAICSDDRFIYPPLSNTPSTVQYNWQRAKITGIQNDVATGSGNPNEQLTNTTSSVINVTYQYTLITTAGCFKTENVIVPVKPTPVLLNQTTVHTICSGQTFIYTPVSTVSSTGVTWTRPSSPPINTGASSSGVDGINETLTNPSGSTAQAVYRYSLTANGCSNTQNVPVNVKPIPVIINQFASICSDNSFSIVPAAPAGTIFGWPTPISSPSDAVTGGTARSLQTLISQTLRNVTTSVGILTYSVTPELNGCSGPDFTVAVTVKPIPVATDIPIPSVCSGVSFTYVPPNVPTGTEYSWDLPVVVPLNGLTSGTAEALKPSLKQVLNSSNNVVNNAEYTVTPSADGCTGKPFKVRISINPVPIVSDQNKSICSESSFAVSPQSVPIGTTYTWPAPTQSPFGSVEGSSEQETPVTSISHFLRNHMTSQASVSYSVTPKSGSCPGTPFRILVAVNPSARLSGSLTPDPICSNDKFNYTPESATAGTTYRWERVPVSGISNPAKVGTGNPFESLFNITNDIVTVAYKYILNTREGCNNTQTVLVQVKPIPAMSSPLQALAICSGTKFHYNPLFTVSGTSYTWKRDPSVHITTDPANGTADPAELLVSSAIFTVHVPYLYTLNANGCKNTVTVIAPVKPTPTANNDNTNTCSKVAFAYKAPNVPTTTRYTWTTLPVSSPSDAITGGSAQMNQESVNDVLENRTLFINNAKYTITPSAEGCGGSPFNLTVVVFPSASIANQPQAPVCSGTTINFAADNVPNGTRYTWSAPRLNADNSLTGWYEERISRTSVTQTLHSSNNIVNTAEYMVQPVTSNCLGTPFKLLITVKPVPVIDDLFDTVCTKLPIVVAPQSVPLNTVYTWQLPIIIPVGSIVGATKQNNPPVSSFRQTLTSRVQAPANAIYSVRSEADGCKGNDFRLTITVGPGIASISNQTIAVCSGIAFNATPKNQLPNTYYSWQPPTISPVSAIEGAEEPGFRRTVISETLTNTTVNNATATYTVRAHNTGCTSNAFLATVTVLPVPQVSINGKMEICRYPFDTLTLNFIGAAPWGLTYRNNNTDQVISGIKTSQYKLAVPSSPATSRQLSFYDIVHSGTCINNRDTSFLEQIIHSLPSGTLHSLHGQYICNELADTLFVTVPEPVSYQWTKNNEPIIGATDDTLITNTEGRYNVTMVNNKGCIDTAAVMQGLINIVQPKLRFMYDSYCINLPMTITNITDTNLTGPTEWQWNFSNGTGNNAFHSSALFATAGEHHIQLKAVQKHCPTNPTFMDSTININFPIPDTTMLSQSAYKGVSMPVSARTFPEYRYQWMPAFGINAPNQAVTFFNYDRTLQYIINLISPAGCITKDSLLVRVFDDKLRTVFVPKSFTPNNDGINDKLFPFVIGIKTFMSFKIFNRFNQLMFETTNYDNGWNGSVNGVPQPMGIYLWIAVGFAPDGSLVEKKGQVLLLR